MVYDNDGEYNKATSKRFYKWFNINTTKVYNIHTEILEVYNII